jgi:hypothetical protein
MRNITMRFGVAGVLLLAATPAFADTAAGLAAFKNKDLSEGLSRVEGGRGSRPGRGPIRFRCAVRAGSGRAARSDGRRKLISQSRRAGQCRSPVRTGRQRGHAGKRSPPVGRGGLPVPHQQEAHRNPRRVRIEVVHAGQRCGAALMIRRTRIQAQPHTQGSPEGRFGGGGDSNARLRDYERPFPDPASSEAGHWGRNCFASGETTISAT